MCKCLILKQGKSKMKMIIDWLNGAGIRRGKDYKLLFKWAIHFNNYHLDITDDNFLLQGYYPISYQTKAYEERVSGLTVFC